jgi:hypothetical protein
MTDWVSDLLQRYRSRGVLVDTNILLLFVVGAFDRGQIGRFKHTRQFVTEDFDLLVRLLGRFERIVTTPNILTEVSNLSGHLPDNLKAACYAEFGRRIAVLDEQYAPSGIVVGESPFAKLGLTDTSILHLSRGKYLVLTEDATLYVFLGAAKVDALNFNHLRPLAWH